MLAPGELVAQKYRVVRLLGEGGMGCVYEAKNERLDKPVALKVLRDPSPAAAERFHREAIAASRVRHPGVVEVYDADVHAGLPWIAMERLEGESLRDRMKRGPVPLADAAAICGEALAALEQVHAAKLVHRDLKPENLFLEQLPDGSRRVKILDFGIVVEAGPREARLTEAGTTIGTPAYLAPEQAAGKGDVDARVDVYAMAVVLFEMLTGRLPYDGDSLGEMVRQMYTTGPAPLVAPGVPSAVSALVATCLAVDRDHRVASAAAFRRALLDATRAAGELGAAATEHAPSAPRPTATAPRSPRWLGGLLSIVVTFGAIAAIVWFGGVRSQDPAGSPSPATGIEDVQDVLLPEEVVGDPNEYIQQTVLENEAPILACHAASPEARDRVVVGVQIVLTRQGVPSVVRTSGGGDALRACLEREFRRMRFDVGPYDANFPITLRP